MAEFRLAVINTQPPHLYYGGVERRITETAQRIETHVNLTIYSGTKKGFKIPTLKNGTTLIPLHSTDKLFPLDNWSFNRSLTKRVAKIDSDVFEVHAVSGYGLPKKLRQLGIKTPFIHTIHGVLADEYEQGKLGINSLRDRVANVFMGHLARLEHQTAQAATLIVTISCYSLHKMQVHYGVEESRVRIVPNGVDTERFMPHPDRVAIKRQFGLGEGSVVLFVGSMIPRKGLFFLVEVAKKVIKVRPDTKFLIVGDGPLLKSFVASLAEAHLLSNFVFLGNLGEAVFPLVYNCADVFVLPSIQEGQGIVLLEAQASALPVVAFDIGGVNEAVQNGVSGLLVERGCIVALADALLRLLGDVGLRERLGQCGRRFVVENYTWALCAKRMLEVYREALALRR